MPAAARAIANTNSQINPFGDFARAHSAYTTWQNGKLVYALEANRTPAPLAECVHANFRLHVLNSEFPCLGAKSAINSNTYRFGFYPQMNTPAATAGLAYDLWEYAQEQPKFETNFATYIASFAGPIVTDEFSWERLLWAQLQSLHDLDSQHHAWDASVSSDPNDSSFSFSFAGRGFFIVGLHPASSRLARRFKWATLVFNLHAQFEQLRAENRFERMRNMIRRRDYDLQGSLNPNLNDFGERSEARQYSGRAVEPDWRCPFHKKNDK